MRCMLCLFLACGAIAGALVAELVPAGLVELTEREVQHKDFLLTRAGDNLVEITDSQWFFLPFLWGDFDLQMDLELSEGAEIDVLLRQVEPRFVDEVIEPFAGRYSVLRLSSEGDAPGWRTRDEALFGPPGNGVGLTPGYLATVWIEARGRRLRANVAGKWQPWFEAEDVYGMFTMVAKGGKAVLHRFEVKPFAIARMWLWSRWTWAAFGLLGAAVVAAIASMLATRPRFLLASVAMLLAAWWAVPKFDAEMAFPDPTGMLLLLTGCLAIALALVADSVRGLWLLGVGALAALLFWSASASLRRDTREVDEWFGPKAGSQISEAHGQLVRTPLGLHDVEFDGPCVFLLGGQAVYVMGAPGDQLGLLLSQQLRGTLKAPVEVPSLGTVDGYSSQQWRLFEQFYKRYRPRAVVFAVDSFEDAIDERSGKPRSSPQQLADTVRQAVAWCQQNDSHLILFADLDLPGPLLQVLREQEARGVPLVVAGADDSRLALARRLRDAIVPRLK